MEMSIAKFRNDMATPINRVAFGGERVVLTRHGEGAVVLVSLEDAALLEQLENDADVRAVRAARKEAGEIPWEQVKAELAVKRLRAQTKAKRPRSRRV